MAGKVIIGTWQDAEGIAIAGGTLTLKLNEDAVIIGTAQIAHRSVSFILDSNGAIPVNSSIWANDQLNPAGTYYTITVTTPGGALVYGPENVTIAGTAPINLNNIIPTGGSSGGGGGTAINLADSIQLISTSVSVNFAGGINTLIEATGGSSGITLTPITAVGYPGQVMKIVKVDSGAGAITINTTAAQTISGRSNWVLSNQWQYVQIESDNSNWIAVAYN